MNINFFITDKSGSEFYVDATIVVDCQEPNPDCIDSDQDCNGWFDVDTEFNLIEGVNENGDTVQYLFDELEADLQDQISDTIDKLAKARN